MNIREVAKKVATDYKMPKAEKYDMVLRDYDDMVEIIGYVQDPTLSMSDFEGREMLFPKRWVTIGVLDGNMRVKTWLNFWPLKQITQSWVMLQNQPIQLRLNNQFR